jgi:virginiamycin A acetyltransferase
MLFKNFFRALRSIISNLLRNYNQQKALTDFNLKTNNNILSTDVKVCSIKGNNIVIQSGSSIDENCSIGSYTYIGFNSRITKASIGNYCSIANNVNIGDGEHPLSEISTSSFFIKSNYDELTQSPCVIGNDVWIGVSCIIRRGVTIGDGAVIGANSFVNKDVLPYTIVAGSPAKLIRKRFDDNKINKILSSRWWNLTPNEAILKFKEIG